MNNDFIRLPLLFVGLCALQVFVFNHVQLFGVAMPLFYVHFVIAMRKGMAKWAMLVWAFVMGITLDIFANTPGVCAASLTLAAMAQPYLLDLFVTREGDSEFIPSRLVLGKKPFFNYVVVFVTAYCAVFFTLEMFSFFNILRWIECVLGSAVLTVALILAVDSLRRSPN